MSDLPKKAASELPVLTSPAISDRVVILDVSEPIAADRLKTSTLENVAQAIGVTPTPSLSRRVVTSTPAQALATDNLLGVQQEEPSEFVVLLPDGDALVLIGSFVQKITVKDETGTATPEEPIVITTEFEGQTIEGQTEFLIINSRGSISFYYAPDLSDWKVIYG